MYLIVVWLKIMSDLTQYLSSGDDKFTMFFSTISGDDKLTKFSNVISGDVKNTKWFLLISGDGNLTEFFHKVTKFFDVFSGDADLTKLIMSQSLFHNPKPINNLFQPENSCNLKWPVHRLSLSSQTYKYLPYSSKHETLFSPFCFNRYVSLSSVW